MRAVRPDCGRDSPDTQAESRMLNNVSPFNQDRSGTTMRQDNLYPGIYAPSGFDIMSILLRVYQRPHPKVELGPVDINCAIIVCDSFAPDSPIVYCSQAFETLTGYQNSEILGRNCRFLQSRCASSNTEHRSADIERRCQRTPARATHEETLQIGQSEHEKSNLAELKTRLERKQEAQLIITNYKKDGSQFQNFLTTIPISWEHDSDELRYIVGFQVDPNTLN